MIREFLLTPGVGEVMAFAALLIAILALARVMWIEDMIAKRYRRK